MFHPDSESDSDDDSRKRRDKGKEKVRDDGAVAAGNGPGGQAPHHDTRKLRNGSSVRLVSGTEYPRPLHGPEFLVPWDPFDKGHTPGFYKSTAEYMRNEWIQNIRRSHIVMAELHGKPFLLFFDEHTRLWNTPEALDVDHVTPWRAHFDALGVQTRRDAMWAYNDLGNLRLVPATYNRGRGPADAILDTHGADSPEWREWVNDRLRFDPDGDYPAYDPDRDGARRQRRTIDKEWDLGVSRKGLKFDNAIKTIWYDHALRKAYAGEVTVPDPDHRDDRSKDHVVQLFRCSVSKQFVTLGGLDIDHERTFLKVLGKMLHDRAEARKDARSRGEEPPPPISRADVFDLFNNPENLRLVSRSLNSSHEYERGLDGEFYDPSIDRNPARWKHVVYEDAPTASDSSSDDEASGYGSSSDDEASGYRSSSDDEASDYGSMSDDESSGHGAMSDDEWIADASMSDDEWTAHASMSDDESSVHASMSDAEPDAPDASDGPDREAGRGAKRAREDDAPDDGEKEKERDPDEGPSPAKRARIDGGDAAPRDSREAVLRAMHPDDAAFFHQMRDAVAGLERSERGVWSAQEQDNLAMGLVHAARREGIRIDALAVSADERTLFGVQGALEQDTGRVGISIATFSGASMEVGAWAVANLRHASGGGGDAPPPPDHHASHHHQG